MANATRVGTAGVLQLAEPYSQIEYCFPRVKDAPTAVWHKVQAVIVAASIWGSSVPAILRERPRLMRTIKDYWPVQHGKHTHIPVGMLPPVLAATVVARWPGVCQSFSVQKFTFASAFAGETSVAVSFADGEDLVDIAGLWRLSRGQPYAA